MGLGIGIDCDRCGEQIGYDVIPFETMENGDKHNLCGNCIKQIKGNQWDKERPEVFEEKP